MDKIDTSPEEEATKVEARQFVSDLLPQSAPESCAPAAGAADGAEIVKAWKSAFEADEGDASLMERFWSIYDPDATSIWTMVYDEADSNEELGATIDMVAAFMKQGGMSSVKDHCFGVVHTLESLEIEGVWFFGGPDPERLFGANDETSWYSWSQLGPEATDLVKRAVASIMLPVDGKLNGRTVKDTKVFC